MKMSTEAKRVAGVKRKLLRSVQQLLSQMTDGERLPVRAKLYQEVVYALHADYIKLFSAAMMEQVERLEPED